MRVYLTRSVRIEADDVLLDERAFGSRQVRLAFVYLVIERRPVAREELADLLWSGDLPATWDASLNALVSKLRSTLRRAGLPASALTAASGCYELHLPPGTWVDVEAASTALHEAEAALRAGDHQGAWRAANIAYNITGRPLLAGEAGEWVERERDRLHGIHVRAAECFALSALLNGEPEMSLAMAEEVIAQEPFRETGYQLLMRAHAAAGNRGEALRAYERCRRILAEELGTDPSAETRALHLSLLED
jgi:DNA-binding SARP family transcriptional activator